MTADRFKTSTGKRRKIRKPRFEVIIVKDRCKGCNLCVEYCPTGTLEMSKEMNSKGNHYPRVRDIKTCKGCELCFKICPDFVIFVVKN